MPKKTKNNTNKVTQTWLQVAGKTEQKDKRQKPQEKLA